MRKFIIIIFTGVLFVVPNISLAKNLRLDFVKQTLISSGFSKKDVTKLFSDKRLTLHKLKTVAYKQPDWQIIKDKLYSPKYLEAGLGYIASNSVAFDVAERTYGVPKEAIAGVLAIESDFGKYSGNNVVLNMIYSRMQAWPAAKWKGQARELIALSKFCIQSKIDCYKIKGSYAGALGLVQFMPTSLLKYGIDGDGDSIINLSKPADAILSAANFLYGHGWKDNQLKALTGYYGSSVGYPEIVIKYASLITPH